MSERRAKLYKAMDIFIIVMFYIVAIISILTAVEEMDKALQAFVFGQGAFAWYHMVYRKQWEQEVKKEKTVTEDNEKKSSNKKIKNNKKDTIT